MLFLVRPRTNKSCRRCKQVLKARQSARYDNNNKTYLCHRCVGFMLSRYTLTVPALRSEATEEELSWKNRYDSLMDVGVFGFEATDSCTANLKGRRSRV